MTPAVAPVLISLLSQFQMCPVVSTVHIVLPFYQIWCIMSIRDYHIYWVQLRIMLPKPLVGGSIPLTRSNFLPFEHATRGF